MGITRKNRSARPRPQAQAKLIVAKKASIKNKRIDFKALIEDKICFSGTGVYTAFEKKYGESHPNNVRSNVENALVKMFKEPEGPKYLKPQNDFYTFINYAWLKETAKEALHEKHYYTQIDDFRVLQDKVYYQLVDMVKMYTKENKGKKSVAINNVYKSLLSLNSQKCRAHMAKTMDAQTTKMESGNLWEFMAHVNDNEIVSWGCPINWNVRADDKNVAVFVDYIDFPQFGLYDPLLYVDDPGQTADYIKYKKEVKRKYLIFIETVFKECLGSNHGLVAEDVFKVEYDMLLTMGCDALKAESPIGYNVITSAEALPKYGFDWPAFSKFLGYVTPPERFICGSLSFLKCMCTLLVENYNTPKWKSFWAFLYLRQMMRFDTKLLPIYYEFNGYFLKGMPKDFPREIYPVFGLSLTFNTFLTQQYVGASTFEGRRNFVLNLGEDLITVFKRIVGRNKWLSPSTKKYALLKLEKIKLDIAQPENLREDPLLEYSPDDAWGNMIKITKWRKNEFVRLRGEKVVDVPQIDWASAPFKLIGKQSYIVNAMYTPTLNNIYIPLAYLQPPFVDLVNGGIESNLAHLGYTLAHEMSHALDNSGSKYDANGNMNDWWTPSDKKKFTAIQDDIIKQYEVFAAMDGIKFDASIGIGEDLADISGLAICEEYLRDYQENQEMIVPERKLSFQRFYVIFAAQQRQHVYKEALAAQLKTNPHPLDKYRTNVPLSRLKLFRSIYKIKKGDKMYWPSESTVW